MNEAINSIIFAVKQMNGIDISMYDKSFLSSNIESRVNSLGCKSFSEYCELLYEKVEETDAFCDSLNITYTQFYRDSITFAILEKRILPSIIMNKANNSIVRVWSAGCSNGQEAYSVAMLLDDICQTSTKKFQYHIFATDCSEQVISFAKIGKYEENMLENIKSGYIKKFFVKTESQYTVCDRIKNNISFAVYNLLDRDSSYPHESIYGDFDIVLCNNLLFYYAPRLRRFIVSKIVKSVSKAGYLITGEAEMLLFKELGHFKQFETILPIFCSGS